MGQSYAALPRRIDAGCAQQHTEQHTEDPAFVWEGDSRGETNKAGQAGTGERQLHTCLGFVQGARMAAGRADANIGWLP